MSCAATTLEIGLASRFKRFTLAAHTNSCILALGGESRSAICLFRDQDAFLSTPIGSLTESHNYRNFVATVDELSRWTGALPTLIAHDCHPLYLSTKYALESKLPTIAVQHHHAHAVSVAAEAGIDGPFIGICCDGLGYGLDGTAWGCEILSANVSSFIRTGSLDPFPLIGTDLSAFDCWRPAAALLRQAFGTRWRREFHLLTSDPRHHAGAPRGEELDLADHLMERRLTTLSSSLGRLFDGVSFILGLADANRSPGDAARALERAALSIDVDPYPFDLLTRAGITRISVAQTIREIVADCRRGQSAALIARRFHETVAVMLAELAASEAEKLGTQCIVLAGGCFLNQLLRERLTQRIQDRDYWVFLPREAPLGDDGLALGQAVIAAAMQDQDCFRNGRQE